MHCKNLKKIFVFLYKNVEYVKYCSKISTMKFLMYLFNEDLSYYSDSRSCQQEKKRCCRDHRTHHEIIRNIREIIVFRFELIIWMYKIIIRLKSNFELYIKIQQFYRLLINNTYCSNFVCYVFEQILEHINLF